MCTDLWMTERFEYLVFQIWRYKPHKYLCQDLFVSARGTVENPASTLPNTSKGMLPLHLIPQTIQAAAHPNRHVSLTTSDHFIQLSLYDEQLQFTKKRNHENI